MAVLAGGLGRYVCGLVFDRRQRPEMPEAYAGWGEARVMQFFPRRDWAKDQFPGRDMCLDEPCFAGTTTDLPVAMACKTTSPDQALATLLDTRP